MQKRECSAPPALTPEQTERVVRRLGFKSVEEASRPTKLELIVEVERLLERFKAGEISFAHFASAIAELGRHARA